MIHTQAVNVDNRPKWFNSPVNVHVGALTGVRRHIPTLRATPFALARAETLADKPSFKRLLNARRCLVLANGFCEWRLWTA